MATYGFRRERLGSPGDDETVNVRIDPESLRFEVFGKRLRPVQSGSQFDVSASCLYRSTPPILAQ
jgi:hypothetical protein